VLMAPTLSNAEISSGSNGSNASVHDCCHQCALNGNPQAIACEKAEAADKKVYSGGNYTPTGPAGSEGVAK
jgi:hypothetical protein